MLAHPTARASVGSHAHSSTGRRETAAAITRRIGHGPSRAPGLAEIRTPCRVLVTIPHPVHRLRDPGCPPLTTPQSNRARLARLLSAEPGRRETDAAAKRPDWSWPPNAKAPSQQGVRRRLVSRGRSGVAEADSRDAGCGSRCGCRSVLPAVPLSSLSSLEACSRGRLSLPRPPLPACSACCQRSRCRSRSPLRSPKRSWGQP